MYSFSVIPWIGQLVANNRDAYQYLVESIRKFPSQEVRRYIFEYQIYSIILGVFKNDEKCRFPTSFLS